MIDYFALALGHGLLVLAFMRLVMRDSLDVDPAISELMEAADRQRSEKRATKPEPQSEPQVEAQPHQQRHQSLSSQKAARRARGSSAGRLETPAP